MFQLPGLDYTEPAFQISVAAVDSLSQVRFFLNVGTTPGGNDVVNEQNLGGALTKLSKVRVKIKRHSQHFNTIRLMKTI